jgi:AhpD family alkylhydroperoxidase
MSHDHLTDTAVPAQRMDAHALAPDAYRAMIAFDRTVGKGIDPLLYLLVKLRASQINGCAFCVDLHSRDARRLGESERRLHALAAWKEMPFFTARERAALALTEAATRLAETHVPDAVWQEAERHFTPSELAHLVLAVAAINAWNRIGVTTRMTPSLDVE